VVDLASPGVGARERDAVGSIAVSRGRGERLPRGVCARSAALALVGVLVAGCGAGPTPTPSASRATPPTVEPADTAPTASGPSSAVTLATASPTSVATPAFADTLTVGWSPEIDGDGWPYVDYGFRNATDAAFYGWDLISPGSVVYNGLYRYDAALAAVPDLADGPCLPRGDGTVIRCRIVETTFHDGTPVTADDVAYSFRLLERPRFSGLSWYTPNFADARVVDPRTVDFVLASVDPAFLTDVLPWVPIMPRHAVEAAYAAFVAATRDLRAADLTKLADAIDEEAGRDPPVCTTRLDAVESLLARIGYPLYKEDFSRTGTFDACDYLRTASFQIRGAGEALGATGIDAVADAYWCLSTSHRPIGAGPYRLASEGPDRIHLEAWPGYHGGIAATRYVDFVPARGDGSDVIDGTVDVYQLPRLATLGPAFEATAASQGIRIATPPAPAYEALQFNVRPGRLFADLALRKAMQLCIDLPRAVDAATGGTGIPVYSAVTPGTWADDPTLPKPARDTAAARALIEGAGWRLGADGVYAKDGVRLATEIVIRADDATRVKIADLIAHQARDCGMDLRSHPTKWDEIQATFFAYPYLVPGTDRPFDIYIGAFGGPTDPANKLSVLASSSINDKLGEYGDNYVGFSDPTLDRLLTAANATYDQATRARLYREAQQEVAAKLPYLYLYAYSGYDVLRAGLATADGPLDLDVPNWTWQPERLVVGKGAQ
jgi:ABC-type transport system substrate-binding protein